MDETTVRFVALDVHRAYVVVGALDQTGALVLAPRRMSIEQFWSWAERQLQPTDQVVLEASSNTWAFYDFLQPRVARVVVANPTKLKVIAESVAKTDRRDTLALARLLAADLIPAVWVPPAHVRELRALIAHRQRLLGQRTMAKNRLRSLLMRHNLTPPVTDPFTAVQRAWWDSLELPAAERLRMRQDFSLIAELSRLVAEVDTELARLSATPDWAAQVPFLLQLPGVGLVVAMTVLSAIGEIQRFPRAKHLVGYAGLGTRVHASGQTHHTGRISKAGRAELRTAMIEAAWAAVRFDRGWKQRFTDLEARIGTGKAIVAIARKLVVIVWHVLTEHVADRQADPVAVARKFVRWGSSHRTVRQAGQSRAAFVRQELNRLGIGAELEALQYRGETFDLGPPNPPEPIPRDPEPGHDRTGGVPGTPPPDGLALAGAPVGVLQRGTARSMPWTQDGRCPPPQHISA